MKTTYNQEDINQTNSFEILDDLQDTPIHHFELQQILFGFLFCNCIHIEKKSNFATMFNFTSFFKIS